MTSIEKIIFTVVMLSVILLSAIVSNSQIPNDIVVGLETGNVKILSNYFSQNVNLVVLDNNNVYSKAQTQQIVGDFFNKFVPDPEKKFNVIHESGKDVAKSVIGTIETQKGEVFRVYFLLKQDDGKEYIHQLRFDKQ
ncbi:MAG: DUF4783 domain-containing protein [Bacteroidales bacterium]|jgi:hypothetical protein|nr:DUF4783 domain-containing protein [Bacteroidales bacterium]